MCATVKTSDLTISSHLFSNIMDPMPKRLSDRIKRHLVNNIAKRDVALSFLPHAACRFVERNIHLKHERICNDNMDSQYCHISNSMCSPVPERRPWVWLEIAGTICVAFSQTNPDSPGWLHQSSVPCFALLCYVLCTMSETALHECVKRFNPLSSCSSWGHYII